RRMARARRCLRDPGPRRRAGRVDRGRLLERGGTAAPGASRTGAGPGPRAVLRKPLVTPATRLPTLKLPNIRSLDSPLQPARRGRRVAGLTGVAEGCSQGRLNALQPWAFSRM